MSFCRMMRSCIDCTAFDCWNCVASCRMPSCTCSMSCKSWGGGAELPGRSRGGMVRLLTAPPCRIHSAKSAAVPCRDGRIREEG